MKRYLVKLIFNVNINNGASNSEFDEQVRVIESSSIEDAFFKARSVGRKEEETFLNDLQEQVKWQFIDVTEIYPLEDIKDGEQVYSNTRKIRDTGSFISYIRQKSMEIQAKSLTFA